MDTLSESAAREDAFFAQIRAATAAKVRTFTRPSRSGGVTHVLHFTGDSLAPLDTDHVCSCKAGSEGRYCWAALEVIADELPRLSSDPGVLERAQMAREIIAQRGAKSGRKAGASKS